MADLQGPKIRVGKFADGKVMLEAGPRVATILVARWVMAVVSSGRFRQGDMPGLCNLVSIVHETSYQNVTKRAASAGARAGLALQAARAHRQVGAVGQIDRAPVHHLKQHRHAAKPPLEIDQAGHHVLPRFGADRQAVARAQRQLQRPQLRQRSLRPESAAARWDPARAGGARCPAPRASAQESQLGSRSSARRATGFGRTCAVRHRSAPGR
jgi:hypothetical protein